VTTTPSNTGNKKKDSFYKKKVTYRTCGKYPVILGHDLPVITHY